MADYLPFAVAYLVPAFVPGVEAATIMSVAVSPRRRDVIPLGLGLLAGKVAILLIALAGAVALMAVLGPWFQVLRYAGAAWLLWLAIGGLRRAFSKTPTGPTGPGVAPRRATGAVASFGIGAALTLGNPLALTFYFAVLPAVVPPGGAFQAALVLSAIVVVIMTASIGLYALLGGLLGRVLAARPRIVDVGASALLILAAALVLLL
ncbi:threonine/homoserine/homoserine lactone efflux protein [Microbacterium resistens]|uniref:Threonine/homoserine/homoserine lactone efflux protein n=1 Tax=Microbacterium resistens TaxID=156977 RepID=A0ABU1SHQ5_9MICO|nr:LysE family transporter [Microbacterium resistens]MDR6868387.1 threonine/homoserine/homoserine lactone efflux protein [Microbacterium resistens]